MKKLLYAAIIGIAMIFAACSDKNSTNQATSVQAEPHETSINIRYVSIDSIYLHYTLAQTTQAEAQKMALDLQALQNQYGNQLQALANQIQQKYQNGQYINQAAYEADMRNLNQKQNAYENSYAQREAKAGQEMALKQQALRDSIDNFLIEFNKERKYDAILLRDAGLYFNPALDITEEVIAGLNARYQAPAESK